MVHSTGMTVNAIISEPFESLILLEPKLKTSQSMRVVVRLTTTRLRYLNEAEITKDSSIGTPVTKIYKSKIDTNTLNNTLLEVIKVLELNGDKYKDDFPVKLNPIEFTIDQEKQKKWLQENDMDENLTAEEVLLKYKQKYEIQNENIEEVRKIIAIRYGIEQEGYSSMSSYTISNEISLNSVAIFEEQNLSFPGIDIETSVISVGPYKLA